MRMGLGSLRKWIRCVFVFDIIFFGWVVLMISFV
jgi:hypothetical protein